MSSSVSPRAQIPATAPPTVAERQRWAWVVAEQCRQVLQRDFGATAVIVFGSLRGDSPWHRDSDLDLAVTGIDAQAVALAYGRLERMVPPWLPFDLVALDQADDRIRDRILQLTPMPQHPYRVLQVRLADELTAIAQTIAALQTALDQADTVAELFLIPTLTAFIEDFYSGCERLAERVAVTVDGGLPQGRNWHEQLLQQLATPGGQGRPPLWDSDLLAKLETYRAFRHRARHLYSIQLDGARVLTLAQGVPGVYPLVEQAVERFSQWLEQQAS